MKDRELGNRSRDERRKLTRAYVLWAYGKLAEDWQPTLLTLTFNAIRGSERAVRLTMENEVEQVYSAILRRQFRRIRDDDDIRSRPLWFVAADFPVFKWDRDHLRDITPNNGRHLHAFALTPPGVRGGHSLSDIVDSQQRFLSGGEGPLFRVHASPITKTPENALDYILKSFKRGRVDDDEIIVLPKTSDEMKVTKAEREWRALGL